MYNTWPTDSIVLANKILQDNKSNRHIDYIDFPKEICWICEGWQEREFIWRTSIVFNQVSYWSLDISGPEYKDPVFIHFDFEGYQPVWIPHDPNEKREWRIVRMCPPGVIHFFYTFEHAHVISRELPSESFTARRLKV